MVKCTACGKYASASGVAACSSCPSLYHKACVGFADTASASKDWACPECRNRMRLKKGGDNSSTPVRGVCGTVEQDSTRHREVTTTGMPPALQASIMPDVEVQDLRREMAECLKEMREFRVQDLCREMSECLNELREFRKEMADFRGSITGINVRMDELEKRLDVVEQRSIMPPAESYTELERTVARLKLDLNERDQELLQSDLEIGHLPEEKGESVLHTVIVLAAKLGVTVEERDVVFAERVGMAQGAGIAGEAPRERRVVVRFARRHMRDQMIQAARVRRTLTAADAGRAANSGSRGRIFINERLTHANRLLFYRVREECRKLQWRFSWTKRGRIYVRQSDGKAAHHIRHEIDFTRVFGSSHV